MKIEIEDVLAFRDEISEKRRELTDEHGLPVVSFTLNIAGDEKRSGLSDFVFERESEKALLMFGEPVCKERIETPAGLCDLFALKKDAAVLKKICMELEDEKNGRLFDFDVADENGSSLSRKAPRKCLICDKPAKECGRNRSHPLSEIAEKTDEILCNCAAGMLREDAKKSLYEELCLTPKPGLVDKNGSGAHSDMDFGLFERSIAAISPFFSEAVLIGLSGKGMPELEALGIKAERAMFSATGGVNTHKGAIFLFLVALCAFGKSLRGDEFSCAVRSLAKGKALPEDTHGASVRQKYGKVGVLYEAKNGFPLSKLGADMLCKGVSPLRTLFEIMSRCEDSTLLYRGGKAALDYVKASAKSALTLSETELSKESARLDCEFIKRGISPGGSADILALSFFLLREKNYAEINLDI